jgi:hypothetical protein
MAGSATLSTHQFRLLASESAILARRTIAANPSRIAVNSRNWVIGAGHR